MKVCIDWGPTFSKIDYSNGCKKCGKEPAMKKLIQFLSNIL